MNTINEMLRASLAHNKLRRFIFVCAFISLIVLTFFPRQYLSRVQIMPPQGSSAGLSSLLSQLGGLANLAPLLGNRQPVEFYLVLARSHDIALDVVKRLNLRVDFGSSTAAR